MLDALALKYGTDKSSAFHNYTELYEMYFQGIREFPINLLEIGIDRGQSIKMWREYFSHPDTKIIGVDRNVNCASYIGDLPNTYSIIADQENPFVLQETIDITKGFGLDIIIDDGEHKSVQEISSFKMLWPQLKSGGVYVIEDLHCNFIQNDALGITSFLGELFADINLNGQSDRGKYDQSHIRDHSKLGTFAGQLKYIHIYQHIIFLGKR